MIQAVASAALGLQTLLLPEASRFRVRELPTANPLEHAALGKPRLGATFVVQVRRWLEALGSSWARRGQLL